MTTSDVHEPTGVPVAGAVPAALVGSCTSVQCTPLSVERNSPPVVAANTVPSGGTAHGCHRRVPALPAVMRVVGAEPRELAATLKPLTGDGVDVEVVLGVDG